MTKEFEIVKVVIHHNRGLFLFARHLGTNHGFQVPEGSMFGNLPVFSYDDEMKSLKKERPDMFVFRPVEIERMFDKQFKEGQIVTLTVFS